jgi:hypothetical protein
MKKFKVFYWRETGDDCIDCEKEIEAASFDEAFERFRHNNPFVKIREICELN